MKRATAVILPPDTRIDGACQTITLAREDRFRRRIVWSTDGGENFLLDLAEATYLPDGAGLVTECGGVIIVRAAQEELFEISAETSLQLSRIAWHIGNRHTPAEITEHAIYIEPDHVLAEMVRGLGGKVAKTMRAFEPEGGAYGGHRSLERGHHHDHHHNHAHGHENGHDHGHQ